ncbi:hypothetical protein CgunFtcFv8_019383 [Champsocephalus gunnari]|uniref:Uncharacterized protein n=1 Tax=Champsocephalus gunnari TaxID=52237 RepID=A0AAN8DHP3_CHAGU|nr:hypothetical protein CgunFtcFv8_019383 [Champsocephalus gunnari]
MPELPSLALSAEIRLCRLGKVLARYSEGNLSSSVIRLGKCQGADAQEQRCCSSHIANHCPPKPPPKHSPPHFAYSFRSPSTPPASAATHSKTIRPINASQPVTWLAARSTAEFLPAVNAVNHITCLQIL